MNFFQQLAELGLEGDLKLTIHLSPTSQKISLSVLLGNAKLGDNAQNYLVPLALSGTAEQLDEGFIAAIRQPLPKTSEMLVGMKAYEVSMEKVEAESKQKKNAEAQKKKEEDELKKIYEEKMKKVDALLKDKKYAEALKALPDAADHLPQAETIKKKRAEIVKILNPPLGLFETVSPPAPVDTDEPADTEREELEEEELEELEEEQDN